MLKKNIALAFLFSLFLSSCFLWSKNSSPPKTDQQLYYEGFSFYKNGKYEKAIPLFQELKDNYPLSKLAPLAELKLADSHYSNKDYEEALSLYEEFKNLHPTHPLVPYVVYQMGMSYFNQILSVDRDQTTTENALKQFEYLINQYPSSEYASLAKQKIIICQEKLAAHSLYIAEFYYNRDNYQAAVNRLEEIIKKFPSFSQKDKIFFYLGRSYLGLKEKEKAQDILSTLIENYPQSKYSKEAKNLLARLK